MSYQEYRKIRVFVASTNEVAETQLISETIKALNSGLADNLRIVLELLSWRDVHPNVGRPQEVILDQLTVQSWDLFIGMLWNRFGTPPGAIDEEINKPFGSGTEEEFRLAYREWSNHGRPRILFFRCRRDQEDVYPDLNPNQVKSQKLERQRQESLVELFFADFAPEGRHPGLYCEYRDATEFVRQLWAALVRILLEQSTETNPTVHQIANKTTKVGLQALVEHFEIGSSNGAKQLIVKVSHDIPFLQTSAQRQAMLAWAQSQNIERATLSKALRNAGPKPLPVNCPDYPLRYVSGGVLPLVRWNKQQCFLLFFRVGAPSGWNIANGGASDARELADPVITLKREFGEEVFLLDEKSKTIYAFDPGSSTRQPGYQSEAINVWRNRLRLGNLTLASLESVTFETAPDSITSIVFGDECKQNDVYVNITLEDSAIEVDRVAKILCDNDAVFLDGDVSDQRKIGRIIGLFPVEALNDPQADEMYFPSIMFLDGRRYPVADNPEEKFQEVLRRYDTLVRETGGGVPTGLEARLCPITIELLRRRIRFQQPSG